jgi:uncharacterized protein YjbI with pentapeptide repeats
MEKYNLEKTYSTLNLSEQNLSGIEFELCVFKDCDFTKADLSMSNFLDCEFENCNFSMVKLANTGIQSTKFKNCKMLGVDFSRCKDFLLSFRFESCKIDYSSFHGKKISKTVFMSCSLKEANFVDADLSASVFKDTDLSACVFNQTNLEKADLREAYGFIIDPEINKLKAAKFSANGLPGLLMKYGIKVE